MFLKNIVVPRKFNNDLIIDQLLNSNKKLVIYGAGTYAYVLFQYLKSKKLRVNNFIVDSSFRNSDFYMGIKIVSLESILNSSDLYTFIVGITNYPYVLDKFKKLEIKSFFVIDVPDFINIPNNFMDYKFVNSNRYKFQKAYSLLQDRLSKSTFINAINTKLTSDLSFILPNVREDHLYFTKDTCPQSIDSVLLDVGGYNGDSIRDFNRITCGIFKHIISLEPFPDMYKSLINTIKDIGITNKCTAIQKGAWDKKSLLSFCNTEMSIDNKIHKDGELKINVNTIDSLISHFDFPVTLIKFDINGAEYRALKGAKKTIKSHRPKLAIKIHTKEDFYRIPILLKSISPDIKIKLRQRNFMSMMLVLYAYF